MGTDGLLIRTAELADAEDLREIYAPYVRDTAITFELEPPSVEEFRLRMERTLARFPYLIAERAGAAVGYASAGVFKDRPAYDWAVETTLYVAPDARGAGVGRALHDALARCLAAQGVLNMYACIAVPQGEDDEYLTHASQLFHMRMGYRLVGEFERCGHKYDRWYDMVWMELMIGEHVPDAPAPRPFAVVRDELRRSGVIAR